VDREGTYRDTIGVLLSDAFCFGFSFLERVFILEFGAHSDESEVIVRIGDRIHTFRD
jgi:hypothetical protein